VRQNRHQLPTHSRLDQKDVEDVPQVAREEQNQDGHSQTTSIDRKMNLLHELTRQILPHRNQYHATIQDLRQQSGAHYLLLPLAKRANRRAIDIVLLVTVIEFYSKLVVALSDDLAKVEC
jgi:hypothetical protein